MPPSPQGPLSPYIEGDIDNAEMTKHMKTQAQVITNHVVVQANLGVGP